MPPKGVSKAVSKKCPECKKQVPVASKLCASCSHQFFEERRKSTASNPSEAEDPEDPDMKPSRGAGTTGNVSVMMASVGKGDLAAVAPEGKRRSERVKREKPNFYDALEYENQMRKARKERHKDDLPNASGRVKRERKVKNNSEPDDDDDEDLPLKEKRRKKKKKNNNNNGEKKKEEEEIDEDIMAGITPEKEKQYAIVLSDINFKLGLNNPRFIKI